MAIITCARCGSKNRVDERAAASSQPVCGKCGAPLAMKTGAGDADTSRPITVTDARFEREVLQAGQRPVLVDCWAPWCGPCRMIAPVLDQLASESRASRRC